MPRQPSVGRELSRIATALREVEQCLGRLVPFLDSGHRDKGPSGQRRRRLPAARRAALKLQGQYVGHMRHLRLRQKARVKALRESKGVRAAVALARRLASG